MKRIILLLFTFGIPIIGFSQVGINTTNPNAQLDITSSNQATPANTDGILIPKIDAFPVTNPAAAQNSMLVYLTTLSAGKVPGFYYWDNPSTSWKGFDSSGWELLGNSGTNPLTNFIGTTDDKDLVFRRNNIRAGKLEPTNTSFGVSSFLLNSTGINNSAFGESALSNNTQGSQNMAFGPRSMAANTTGTSNTSIGFYSLTGNTVGDSNVAIGSSALNDNKVGSQGTAIGNSAMSHIYSGLTPFTNYNVAIGYQAMFFRTSTAPTNNGNYNTAIGHRSLYGIQTANNNIGVGYNSLFSNRFGNNNIAIGNQSLLSFAYDNSGTAYDTNNVAVGYLSLFSTNPTTVLNGLENTAIGNRSLDSNTTGNKNTAFGFNSGGTSTTGSNNITIGANSNVPSPTANDQMSIGNVIYGADMSTSALGKIGIGVSLPTEKLEIAGKTKTTNFQMTTGATLGNVLTSDALGNATWQIPAVSNAWSITGNSGTNPTVNFIGTTDNNDLVFRRNNTKSGFIGDENVAFGNAAMLSNTFAGKNIAIGKNALSNQSFANGNSAFDTNNIAIGIEAMFNNNPNSTSNGKENTVIGNFALRANSTGNQNIAIGNASLNSNSTGFNNVSIGNAASSLNFDGNNNTALGTESLISNRSGSSATAIGYQAMRFANSTATTFENKSVAVGYRALLGSNNPVNNTGNNNTAVGYQSISSITSGNNNTAIGNSALTNNNSGSSNIALGNNTLSGNTTGSGNIAIGDGANVPVANNSNQLSIANVIYGTNMSSMATAKIGIGVFLPSEKLEVDGKTKTLTFQMTTGALAGRILVSDAVGNGIWTTIGSATGGWLTTGNAGTNPAINFVGTTDNNDLLFKRNGIQSGLLNSSNTSFGVSALNVASTGTNNTALGNLSLANNTSGASNVALGTNTLNGNTTGSNNIAIGTNANVPVTNNSDQLSISNVLFGINMNTTATGKIGIGLAIPTEKLQVSENIKIGNNAWSSVADNRFLKFGDANFVTVGEETGDDMLSFKAKNFIFNPSGGYTGNVGIGVLAATEKLEVAGKTKTTDFQMTTGAGIGRVLTSDAVGNGIWSTPVNTNWSLTGNAGTNSVTNFVGTTDNNDLIFKRNNTQSGLLNTTNTSFGVSALNTASTGINNTALGRNALILNSSGFQNTAIGSLALPNNTSGSSNIGVGANTLNGNTTGSNNIAIGTNANVPVTNNSDQLSISNVLFGVNMNTIATGKIGIGLTIPTEKLQVSDNLKVGNNSWSTVADNRYLKFGDLNFVTIGEETGDDMLSFKAKNFIFNPSGGYTGNVGIGVLAATEKLEVAGKTKTTDFQMTTGAGLGRILTSDALGNGIWSTPVNTNWSLTGNAGTNAATNFIGTTDNNDLIFKRNNTQSGLLNTTNTSFGVSALNTASTGINNTALGKDAMLINTSGSQNIAIGNLALSNNTSQNSSVVIGYQALMSLTGGNGATAIGTRAMQNQTYSSDDYNFNHNVAVGYEALLGSSISNENIGNSNTALGFQSLTKNGLGSYNTSIGDIALSNNNRGEYNTVLGSLAAYGNTNASSNIAVGTFALFDQSFSNGNVAYDTNNVAIGNYALSNLNSTSNTDGMQNTVLGNDAGTTITTGNNNIIVGYNAQVPLGTGNNQLRLGNTAITYAAVQVPWTITSDKRWKSNIQTSNLGLDFIKKLNPVSYIRNNDESKKTEYGFIAQELEKTLNNSNAINNGIISKDDTGMYSVRYNDLISISVKAIQEQQGIIEKQNEKIKALETTNTEILKRLEKLENK